MNTLRIEHRALTLATRGILANNALSRATRGILQQPVIDIPIEIPQKIIGGGGSTFVYFEIPEHYRFDSQYRLFLTSNTQFEYYKAHEPLNIETTDELQRAYFFKSTGELILEGTADFKHLDRQGNDDMEILLLLAARLFWDD